MQRTLTSDDRSFSVIETSARSFCLVCEAALNVESSTNIFYASLPRNGELLASFVLRVLRPVANDLRSSYICSRCNQLFQMLEQAQWTVSNVRCEILKVYRSRDGDKASVRKIDLVEEQILPDELFLQSEHKNVFDGDRFNQIGGFGTSNVENNDNVGGGCAYEDSQNEFCNFNIRINNDDEKLEESLEIGNKINCVGTTDENIARTNVFGDATDDFCDGNNGSDNGDGSKSTEPFEIRQNNIYERKYDCLGTNEPIESSVEKDVGIKPKNWTINVPNERETISNNSFDKKIDIETAHRRICPRVLKNCSKHDDFVVAAEPWNNDIENFNSEHSMIFEQSAINVKSVINNNKKDNEEPWESARVSKYSLKPLKHCCATCGKKWRTSAELKTHVKSHSNLRPYMCEKCGQAYKHKHALEIHVGMHNGTSPFRCSVCDKCFTQKGALMRHLPMHTGEMPYQCELCGKRFVHHTSYNMHALSHTGKKSYRCHVCDLSLLSTSHLKRHMRVHTGEKPYSCELCGKSFAERYNLFAHQKIHDPAEIMAKAAKKITYKCEQCDEFFDKKHKLDDHAKERHVTRPHGGLDKFGKDERHSHR